MKKNELLLMSYLRQNSRSSLTNLSKKTGIPISSIFDKLKKRCGNVIRKHVSLLDFEQLGFSIRISMLLKVGKSQKNQAQEFLSKFFNVNSLHKVNNGYDFMMEAIFHNLRELEEFGELIENKFSVKKKEIFYIIEEIKKEEFLADPKLLDYVVVERPS